MMGRQGLVLAAVLLILAALTLGWPLADLLRSHDRDALTLGRTLYAAHCAACHGTDLEGQPDWQTALPDGRMPAPPLDRTGHVHHHPEAELFRIVKHGMASVNDGRPTDMPAFENVLSDEEIRAVIAFVRSRS